MLYTIEYSGDPVSSCTLRVQYTCVMLYTASIGGRVSCCHVVHDEYNGGRVSCVYMTSTLVECHVLHDKCSSGRVSCFTRLV